MPEGEIFEEIETVLAEVSRPLWPSFFPPLLPDSPIAFSPDGSRLAAAADDQTVRLWDTATGEEIQRLEGYATSVLSVAFSPDGSWLAAADDWTVRLWDVATGEEIQRFEGHASAVRSVAFSPGGSWLAAALEDRTVRLWNMAAEEEIQRLTGHTSWVLSVAFSPDGSRLASASDDRTVRLWDMPTGEEIQRLEGHESSVCSVAFSPDGSRLASASNDRTVRLWDVTTGEEIQRLEGHANWVRSVAFGPDGSRLASASDDRTVRLWDVATGEEIQRLEGHAFLVRSVAFSPDGSRLASASEDGTVRLWDVATGEEIQRLEGHASSVRSVAFSPDGSRLASASGDGTVRILDAVTGEEAQRLEGDASWVQSVAFSPDGSRLVSASSDGMVRLWNEEIQRLEGDAGRVLFVVFSPDGSRLASASSDRTVRLWDVATGEEIQRLKGDAERVLSLAFSPDGSRLASVASDGTVRLWEVATGEEIQRLSSSAHSVAFSPDGLRLASASSDATVRLWDVVSGEEIQRLEGHAGRVLFVAFNPGGSRLASVSDDGTVRLWGVPTGKEIQRIEGLGSGVLSVAFSPDGSRLASASSDGTVRLWEASSESEGTFRGVRVLLGGVRGTWVSCRVPENRCWRHDDGTLLRRRLEGGRFEPIPPPGGPAQLELIDSPTEIETEDGQRQPWSLRVKNVGEERAFWIRVRQGASAKAPFGLSLPTLTFLDPGETADLRGWVSTYSSYLDPKGQTSTLYLEVTSLRGAPIPVPPIEVRARTPSLEWKRALWGKQKKFVAVELKNVGDQPLPPVMVRARLSGHEGELNQIDQGMLIPPGNSMRVPFGVPEDFEPTPSTRLTFSVHQLSLPGHRWNFENKPIQNPIPWTLLSTLTGLLLAVAALSLVLHPLVRELSAEPASLHHRSPAELPRARRLLRLTGRLPTVLARAGVERGLLDRAITFFQDPASRAERLAERLGVEPASIEGSFAEDEEFLTLPVGADFPLNLDHLLLHLPTGRPATDVLARLKARPETRDQITLIVADRPARQDVLHRLIASDLTTLQVAPSGSQLTELLLGTDPVDTLARIIATQVRVTRLSPYQTGGGVHRPAVFFGRQDLLAHILNRDPANYLVVGGRQMGKSSLLKSIERHYRDDPRVDCRYLVLSGADFVGSLARALGLDRGSGLDAVIETLTAGHGRTLCLVDEADTFIRSEGAASPTLARLRSLSEEGRCHFLLAGFWNLYAAAVLDYQSPLKNFGETLRVEALEAEACYALATRPMATMGLRYAGDELVERIVTRTGQRANLISIVCNEILKNLGPRDRVISPDAVETALASWAVDDALDGWRDLGGDDGEGAASPQDGESRLDRVLVYATIGRDGFTLGEAARRLEEVGVPSPGERLRRSLKRLELAYVLKREGERYVYPVPLFVERLRELEPDVLLRNELG